MTARSQRSTILDEWAPREISPGVRRTSKTAIGMRGVFVEKETCSSQKRQHRSFASAKSEESGQEGDKSELSDRGKRSTNGEEAQG